MMTDNFNFERFRLVFKRDLIENWGKSLRTYIGMFLGFFVTMLILHPQNVIFGSIKTQDPAFESVLMVPLAFVTVLYVFVGLSGMFSNLSHKQSRISFFMLPASNLEKYLVRLLRCSIIFWVIIVLCFILADFSAYVVHYIMGGHPYLLLPKIFSNLEKATGFYMELTHRGVLPNLSEGMLVVSHLASALAWMGTYILGAAIFRKQPFILTSLTIFAVSTLATLVTVFIGSQFLSAEQQEAGILNMEEWALPYFYFTIVFNVVWTVFCIWITYRMFKNANVIAERTIGL